MHAAQVWGLCVSWAGVSWGALLPLCHGVLTCRTFELGEDGLSLGVTLPTLLQEKVAQVSDTCPPYPQLPGARLQPQSSRGRLQEDRARQGQQWSRIPDQGLRGRELSFYLSDFRGGLCLADVAQHMRPILQVDADLAGRWDALSLGAPSWSTGIAAPWPPTLGPP